MGGDFESRCVDRVYGADGAYVPEICLGNNTSINLPYCIKLAFHITS